MASWKEESRGKEVGVLGAVSGAVREPLRSSLTGWEYHAHSGRGSSCLCRPSLALLGTMSELPCWEMFLDFGLSSSPFMEWGTTIAFQHSMPSKLWQNMFLHFQETGWFCVAVFTSIASLSKGLTVIITIFYKYILHQINFLSFFHKTTKTTFLFFPKIELSWT